MSDLTPTCFDAIDPPLYLSSAHLPQPYNNDGSLNTSLRVLKDLGINAIINMSTDSPTRPHHLQFYKNNEIDFYKFPIEDSSSPVNANFLNGVVQVFQENKKNKKLEIKLEDNPALKAAIDGVLGNILPKEKKEKK